MKRICCECDLPEEVLEEIFSWLPPESLIQFKCVSKSWYALINSLMKNQVFVNKHLHNIDKISSSTSCLILCHYTYITFLGREFLHRHLYSSLTISHDDDDDDDDKETSDLINCVTEYFHFPTLPRSLTIGQAMASHCNGIICLTDYNGKVILFNPSIKECRTLPKLSLSYFFVTLAVGFGYDSRANDYKVVRFGLKASGQGFSIHPVLRAQVYSMRNCSWRKIRFNLEFDCHPTILHNAIFCKETLYWCVKTNNYMIVSFDMYNEVFHSIPLPNDLVVTREENIKLAVWNEFVALFLYPVEGGVPKSIEVWVMDDCSGGGITGSFSWIKKLTIGPPLDIKRPLTFLKNDQILLETNNGGLILFDVRSQQLRKLSFDQEEDVALCWDFSYVKTLVSVQSGSQYC